MKEVAKILLPAVALATALFVAHGSGHVPRPLLLISDQAVDLTGDVGTIMPVIPMPAPIVLARCEENVVVILPQVHPPIMPDPALPSLGDRSPPPSPLA